MLAFYAEVGLDAGVGLIVTGGISYLIRRVLCMLVRD